MSPTEPYKWHDLDDAVIVKFCLAFRECFEELVRTGHVEVTKRLSFEDYQVVMTPRIVEAAEIMLNAPRRRGKAWPQPVSSKL